MCGSNFHGSDVILKGVPFFCVYFLQIPCKYIARNLKPNKNDEILQCIPYQRPDHYTYQVSVYLPSISILIIILSIKLK